MKTTLTSEKTREISARLSEANREFAARYPGESFRRQPVHTVYGGAHLFKSDSAVKLGAIALRTFDEYGADPFEFSAVTGIEAGADLARAIHQRVRAKLEREPVEDFRIDFEDGYGNRADDEEDGHAQAAALARRRRPGRTMERGHHCRLRGAVAFSTAP